MGSGVSMPNKLNEEDLRNLCGDAYEPALYTSLHNKDGLVDRDNFIAITSNGEEYELYTLYRSYALNDGRMDQQHFTEICRDTKLLSKHSFTVTDSSETFNELSSIECEFGPLANYESFRHEILPKIATKKRINMADLVHKLACVDADETKAMSNDYWHQSSKEEHDARLMLLLGDDEVENEKIRKQWKAAVMLQRVERQRIAKRKTAYLKEVFKCRESERMPIEVDVPVQTNDDREAALCQLFALYCKRNEMPSKMFVDLCKDAHVISQKFTVLDARMVFEKTKAIASSDAAKEYNDGVLFDKRITYKVFREVLLPCLAKSSAKSLSELFDVVENWKKSKSELLL